MPVIGTAGHVDHGKSTLVRALTGRDPDRWEEEKRRGLTIDLGFAWTELPGGVVAGFVDVPGHERFIKNMLAGVDGIDVALFVVAADEGWMPQSEEHLAVLDLIGVRGGVVALTRSDLVDDDLLELALLEVQERLEGTVLEAAPLIPVAAPSGDGVDRIAGELARALTAAGPPRDAGRPRLWVDRSFVIAGAGTVVTGTLTGGGLAVGDEVGLWPGEATARVRSLQSHEQTVERAEPGSRAAANLAGLERTEVQRGAMVGLPGQWSASDRLVVTVRPVRSLDEPLGDRGAYHLHFGSGAWPVRLRMLEPPDRDGETAALLRVAAPIPVTVGDRFILRDVGRRAVVGGGRVLDPAPSGNAAAMRRHLDALRGALDGSPEVRASTLLAARGVAELGDLAAHSGGGRPATGVVVEGWAMSTEHATALAERAVALVRRYQQDNPLRPGMPKASLASALGCTPGQLQAVSNDRLIDEGTAVRTPDFGSGLGAAEELAWEEARSLLTDSGLAVPRASQLGLDRELFHALLRAGRLVRIGDDLVYLPEQIDEILGLLTTMRDGFTVAEFRDGLGVTRRQAVPLLEWLDRAGHTVREGDGRRVRPPRPDEPGPDVDPTR